MAHKNVGDEKDNLMASPTEKTNFANIGIRLERN